MIRHTNLRFLQVVSIFDISLGPPILNSLKWPEPPPKKTPQKSQPHRPEQNDWTELEQVRLLRS